MDDELPPEDELRREALIKLLAMGAFSMAPVAALEAAWWGSKPDKLPEKKSFFSLEGEVLVNKQQASINTRVNAGDLIQTGRNSEAVFVVGSDSFIMRSDSILQLEGSNFLLDSLRLLSGGLLSVFGRRTYKQNLNVSTTTATLGIRGTGVYLESQPDLTYLCTCYGSVELRSAKNPDDVEYINTKHHDDPKYISDKAVKGTQIRDAPFINHTDPELKMLEALVGREVPFGMEEELYRSPRRDY
jgi:hypothetical protein